MDKSKQSISFIFQSITGWYKETINFIPHLIVAVLIILIAYFIARITKSSVDGIVERSRLANGHNHNEKAYRFISTAVFFVILAIGIFLAFDVLELTNILAGAGVIGIIVGFALKGIVSNLFSGVLIKIWTPYELNHWVIIDGQIGCIYKIDYAVTKLRTIENTIFIVPNRIIFKQSFMNYSVMKQIKVVTKVGVSYGDNLAVVKQTALDAINNLPCSVNTQDTKFFFTDIGSSTYNFEVWFWINFHDIKDFYEARSKSIMAIKEKFEEQNICIAYNVMTLDFGVKGGVNIFDKNINIHNN